MVSLLSSFQQKGIEMMYIPLDLVSYVILHLSFLLAERLVPKKIQEVIPYCVWHKLYQPETPNDSGHNPLPEYHQKSTAWKLCGLSLWVCNKVTYWQPLSLVVICYRSQHDAHIHTVLLFVSLLFSNIFNVRASDSQSIN